MRIKEDRWSVANFVESYTPPEENNPDKEIFVPECQRQWAWKATTGLQKQQKLIDSVMNGFPIPTCILNRTQLRKFEVYDGRHRIETMYRYANDKFAWNGKLYSELTDAEKDKFNNREIPVTIVKGANEDQLAEVFTRLNKGAPLNDSDHFWANRSKPLVAATRRLVVNHERLAASLGYSDLSTRNDLANWVALVRGLNTRNAGNISTSHIRAFKDGGMEAPVDDAFVMSGLDALATLYETANREFPADNNGKRRFKKVGYMTAFFVADWLKAEDKDATIQKWVGVIGRLRGDEEKAKDMRDALITTGAQNLNATKIAKVLKQVHDYVEHGIRVSDAVSDDEDGDSN